MSSPPPLFDLEPADLPPRTPADAANDAPGKPRLRTVVRDQIVTYWASLDQLLDADHEVRVVWAAVSRLDLSRWLASIRAVEGSVGRDSTDPHILVALWVFATLRGIASGRELEKLCEEHIAYRWICGGVSVNRTMLNRFRSDNGDAWSEMLTQIVASLMAEGLVTLERVAQDGMRVRANAGASSFRRRTRLEECVDEARAQVEALQTGADESTSEAETRRQAARRHAAEDRLRRMDEAIKHCDQLREEREASAEKSGREAKEARASTTDPEARVMKMPDGGYRPAYNAQFSTESEHGVIVGVDVTNVGSDQQELPPMLDQLQTRYGDQAQEAMVDGGFASQETIEAAAAKGCAVYAPVKNAAKQRAAGQDPYARKSGDSDAVAAWRARMGTPLGETIYKLRCQTAEWVNAGCRNRRLWQMPLRGLVKCRIVATIHAIAHNLRIAVALRAGAVQTAG